MNTSATGGPLAPLSGPSAPPVESSDLLDFLQGWVVSITGIDGSMVRPRWVAEPANIPDAGEAWIAFGITNRKSDTYPAFQHVSDEDGHSVLHRHETLTILCSFYDTGSTGLADYYGSLMRDGTAVPQNQEYLVPQRCSFISVGDLLNVPSLFSQRWLVRMDLEITLKREILRDYAILNVVEGVGTIITDTATGVGLTIPFDAKPNYIQIAANLSGASDLSATPS